VVTLVRSLPNLADVTFHSCSLGEQSAVPSDGPEARPRLSAFYLEDCMNVSDELLAALGKLCPRLEDLFVTCAKWLELPGVGGHAGVWALPSRQCCGCGSTCFWASWIRIHQSEVWIRIRIWILLSQSINSKKNLDSYCFVTSF
jgi:hypothetical protein